eukprot:s1903_g22.t1
MAVARGRPPPKPKAAVAKPVPYHLKPKEVCPGQHQRCQRPKSPKLSSRPEGSAAIDAGDLRRVVVIAESPRPAKAWADYLNRALGTRSEHSGLGRLRLVVLGEGAILEPGVCDDNHPAVAELQMVAKKNNVIIAAGSMVERDPSGHSWQTCALVGQDGLIGSYRKQMLGALEAKSPNLGIFTTPMGRIGILICLDIEDDTLLYQTAQSCDIIVNPAHIPHCGHGQRSHALQPVQRRLQWWALACNVSIVRCDLRPPMGMGTSMVVTPCETFLASAHLSLFEAVVSLKARQFDSWYASRHRSEFLDNTGAHSINTLQDRHPKDAWQALPQTAFGLQLESCAQGLSFHLKGEHGELLHLIILPEPPNEICFESSNLLIRDLKGNVWSLRNWPRSDQYTRRVPNTVIVITPNVFKNEVVKEAYEASVTTKKNVVFLHHIVSGCNLEEEAAHAPEELKKSVDKIFKDPLRQSISLSDLSEECNDMLIEKMNLRNADEMKAAQEKRSQGRNIGILKSSAKVAKAFTQAGVKRKFDLCLTAANAEHSPDGMPVVDHLFTTMSKLAPALQIGRNYGDKDWDSFAHSFNIVVVLTKDQDEGELVLHIENDALTCPDLQAELKSALEAEASILIVHHLLSCPNFKAELEKCEDRHAASCSHDIRRDGITSEAHVRVVTSVLLGILSPGTVSWLHVALCRLQTDFLPNKSSLPQLSFHVHFCCFELKTDEVRGPPNNLRNCLQIKTDDTKSPRTRQALSSGGGKQFRLEYKNFYSLDLAKDGTGQVYNTKFSDKKKDLPGDIDSAIKALFELYDPLKKGTIGWPQFAEVDRIVTECLGGQYEEMISRRAFSMMNYPGQLAFVAKQMGALEGDRDASMHYKYIVDKASSTQLSQQDCFLSSLGGHCRYVVHDESKESIAFAKQLKNSMKDHTPNVRTAVCNEKVPGKEDMCLGVDMAEYSD